ncbi:hypothetical protein [Streptomyces sp. NPDC017993]|uniref:hypothetical protein n=1 Tax=Streptomyces sp. NPDC017993 TaxID=3365027 RepID=UPI0037B0E686
MPIAAKPAGDTLRQALELEYTAQRQVERAVIAKRESGTTWDQTASVVGTTR